MASRRAERQAARERRREVERASAARASRVRRLRVVGGAVTVGIGIVVVAVLTVGSGHHRAVTDPRSAAARSNAAQVGRLLNGIPEHGVTLGDPRAAVTLTEYGDLECPVCAAFAEGSQAELIDRGVRAGSVKLVYRSAETATAGGPDAQLWPLQQAAADAAGRQNRAWYYIELFYREQGAEDSGYATTAFLQSVARQVPRLDVARWNGDRFAPALAAQVLDDGRQAAALGINGTPTVVASGPRGRTRPFSSGEITYGQLQSLIRAVS